MKDESTSVGSGRVRMLADSVGKDWRGSPYYLNAERKIGIFWRKGTVFWRLFSQLDAMHLVELACGHGRHAEITKALAHRVTLLDILEENIVVCRKRFEIHPNVHCYQNNGVDLRPVEDGDASAVFCYDAMVHFPEEVVASYLADCRRVLKHGGLALLHHSNYGVKSDLHYGRNPQARNFMTRDLFKTLAGDVGLVVKESVIIPWGGVPGLDCVTLVQNT